MFNDFLDQPYSIIQAPMAGGATTPELIAAVCAAGGLGSLGAGYLQPEDLRKTIRSIQALTEKPFQVNLFIVDAVDVDQSAMQVACDAVQTCATSASVSMAIEPVEPPFAPSFEEQLAVCVEEGVSIISFTFGLPDQSVVDLCHQHNMVVMGTATTLEEAQACKKNGMDAIVLQGEEAGGHRGSFLKPALQSLVPLETLLLECCPEFQCPLIVAGGIMNRQSMLHYLALGADAVQMGTAFLCTQEAGIPEIYKQTLCQQTTDSTVLTRAFSGAYARGIENRFTQCMRDKEDAILPYPAQNRLTKTMRQAAKEQANPEAMSLWAGRSVAQARYQTVSTLMQTLMYEDSV